MNHRTPRRPRAVSPMFGRRPHREDGVPAGRILVDMNSPGDVGFKEGIHRAVRLIREDAIAHFNVIATMPASTRDACKGKNGFVVENDAELNALDIQPWAIAEYRKDKKPRMLLKVAMAVDDIEAVTSFGEVISLFPKIVRAFLAIIRPWHLALLGVEGFEDTERPDDVTLAKAAKTAVAQLRKWGIKLEVVEGDNHGS